MFISVCWIGWITNNLSIELLNSRFCVVVLTAKLLNDIIPVIFLELQPQDKGIVSNTTQHRWVHFLEAIRSSRGILCPIRCTTTRFCSRSYLSVTAKPLLYVLDVEVKVTGNNLGQNGRCCWRVKGWRSAKKHKYWHADFCRFPSNTQFLDVAHEV